MSKRTCRRIDVRDAFLPLVTAAGLALALLPLPVAAQANQEAGAARQAGGVSVAGAVVTSGVTDHMPVDTLSTVPADIGRAFLWTRITGAQDSTTVVHVWYRDEEEATRVDLPVNGSDWRTYSTKRILPSWTGPWRVEIRDVSGQVLQTVSFTVGSGGGR